MKPITVILTCDHAGFEAKQEIFKNLETQEHISVIDVGPQVYDATDDYPVTVAPMCKVMQEIQREHMAVFGVVVARSGQGEAMVSNRFKGIRAIVVNNANDEVVILGRQHNDANVISLASQFLSVDEMNHAIDVFLNTSFSEEERHARRIALIDDINMYE